MSHQSIKKIIGIKMKGDDLPNGLDLYVFDFGVNAGLHIYKYLQTMIGTVADGGIDQTH